MERLDDLEAFVAVVEKGSQAAASRHLRRPLQSLNRSLIALERSVGVELVKRTTRRSEPTEAGKLFYERIKPAVAEILEARNEAASIRAEVSGPLKIGAPVLFASSYVAPIIGRFLKLYPKVEIELKASDDQVDLVAEGLDLAVRIGESVDEQLTARRLQALRVVTCGAPSYLAQHGIPKHPDELENHHCVLRAGPGHQTNGRFASAASCTRSGYPAAFTRTALRRSERRPAKASASRSCRSGRSGSWLKRVRWPSSCRSSKPRACRSSLSGHRRKHAGTHAALHRFPGERSQGRAALAIIRISRNRGQAGWLDRGAV